MIFNRLNIATRNMRVKDTTSVIQTYETTDRIFLQFVQRPQASLPHRVRTNNLNLWAKTEFSSWIIQSFNEKYWIRARRPPYMDHIREMFGK